jgi:hypothetical protein
MPAGTHHRMCLLPLSGAAAAHALHTRALSPTNNRLLLSPPPLLRCHATHTSFAPSQPPASWQLRATPQPWTLWALAPPLACVGWRCGSPCARCAALSSAAGVAARLGLQLHRSLRRVHACHRSTNPTTRTPALTHCCTRLPPRANQPSISSQVMTDGLVMAVVDEVVRSHWHFYQLPSPAELIGAALPDAWPVWSCAPLPAWSKQFWRLLTPWRRGTSWDPEHQCAPRPARPGRHWVPRPPSDTCAVPIARYTATWTPLVACLPRTAWLLPACDLTRPAVNGTTDAPAAPRPAPTSFVAAPLVASRVCCAPGSNLAAPACSPLGAAPALRCSVVAPLVASRVCCAPGTSLATPECSPRPVPARRWHARIVDAGRALASSWAAQALARACARACITVGAGVIVVPHTLAVVILVAALVGGLCSYCRPVKHWCRDTSDLLACVEQELCRWLPAARALRDKNQRLQVCRECGAGVLMLWCCLVAVPGCDPARVAAGQSSHACALCVSLLPHTSPGSLAACALSLLPIPCSHHAGRQHEAGI